MIDFIFFGSLIIPGLELPPPPSPYTCTQPTTPKTYSNAIHRRNPTRLDANVYSVVTAETGAVLLQRKRAQRCDSRGSDSAEVAICTLVLQRWQPTALSVAAIFVVMCSSLLH